MSDETKPKAKPKPRVVVTVVGNHTVDGVAPGSKLPKVPELARLRYLMRAGHVTAEVDGKPISDAHIVAKMEGA